MDRFFFPNQQLTPPTLLEVYIVNSYFYLHSCSVLNTIKFKREPVCKHTHRLEMTRKHNAT